MHERGRQLPTTVGGEEKNSRGEGGIKSGRWREAHAPSTHPRLGSSIPGWGQVSVIVYVGPFPRRGG